MRISPYFKKFDTPTASLSQGVLGTASMGGNMIAMARQGANLPNQLSGQGSYQGGYWNQINRFEPQRTDGREVLSGALQGAVAGQNFGFDPVSKLIGAGIGAGVGTLGTIFAGNKRRQLQTDQHNAALSEASAYQGRYNAESLQNKEAQIAEADYMNRLNYW